MSELIIRDEQMRQSAIDLLSRLDVNKPWRFTLVRYVKKRSISQNAMFHSWCSIIANEVGDDMESVKHDLKSMFLPKVERESRITGEIRLEPKHTSELNTMEMKEFMDKIYSFAAAQLEILLPVPEEQHMRAA